MELENDITYSIDTEHKYLKDIREGLQTYNKIYTGEKENDKQNFYVVEDSLLLGGIHTSFGWDWIYIEKIFYTNQQVLNALIYEILNYYKEKAFGIIYTSHNKERIDALLKAGFYSSGHLIDMPKGSKSHFLVCEIDNTIEESSFNVVSSKEIHETYSKYIEEKEKEFTSDNNISTTKQEIVIASFKDDLFIGGVYGFIKNDYLYVSLMYVNEEYRGLNIATNLMNKIESEAIEKGIDNSYLGTCEFQAKPFYIKLGYKLIITMQNYPKGYEEYTLYKKLK